MKIKTWKFWIIFAVLLIVFLFSFLAYASGNIHDSIGFGYAAVIAIMSGLAIFDIVKTKKSGRLMDKENPPVTFIDNPTQEKNDPRFWSIDEIKTVYNWMKRHEIAVDYFGGCKFIMTDTFPAFIEKNKDGKVIYGYDADPEIKPATEAAKESVR